MYADSYTALMKEVEASGEAPGRLNTVKTFTPFNFKGPCNPFPNSNGIRRNIKDTTKVYT